MLCSAKPHGQRAALTRRLQVLTSRAYLEETILCIKSLKFEIQSCRIPPASWMEDLSIFLQYFCARECACTCHGLLSPSVRFMASSLFRKHSWHQGPALLRSRIALAKSIAHANRLHSLLVSMRQTKSGGKRILCLTSLCNRVYSTYLDTMTSLVCLMWWCMMMPLMILRQENHGQATTIVLQ